MALTQSPHWQWPQAGLRPGAYLTSWTDTSVADQKKGFFGKSQGNSPMEDDDQAFLSQIEENIRSAGSEQMDAQKEAEHRAREMERIRNASAHIRVPGAKTPTPAAGQPSQKPVAPKANPLENDPRYREYFERLRKQKGEAVTPAPHAPAGSGGDAPQAVAGGGRRAAASTQKIGPGSIVRFDDGSIGVYKDAVSGRDYALFYFLNPAGDFVPEGVFLQCYQARAIGQLPEEYFSQLRDDGQWNRDMILYHLTSFDFVKDLNGLAEHQPRKPSGSSGATPAAGTPSQASPAAAAPPPAEEPAPAKPEAPKAAPAPENDQGLIKGRRFQIKFGGKQWEAVYWDADGENSIVAHSTHGNWSLMRLDLSRFKDSLELLDRVDDATLEEIATQAAGGA